MAPMNRRELLQASAGALALAACGPRRGDAPAEPPPTQQQHRGPGAVATSQHPATDVGVRILEAGGNAADAAVAIAAALNVGEPTSTGLGGDCFALYYDAATRALTALNGSGRAPAALTIDLIRSQGVTTPELPMLSVHAITVPGACAGWCDLLARHGSLPLASVLAPAIELAEDGFPIGELTAHAWERAITLYAAVPSFREMTIDGRAPRPGERFRNPGLARALRQIAAGGADAFYRGDIAAAIAAAVRAAGGVMTTDDLAAHRSTWDAPISTTYRGFRVWECPPNGQGVTALLALNLLADFDLAALDPLGPDRMHLLIEAMRVAFADTRWYVADPAFHQVPVAELLSPEYARSRRALIDPRRAAADVRRGAPVAGSDTVYFCVVDGFGNACSFINSNYGGFGTGLVPAGWGFTLQNRGACFRLDPAHPNALAPRKRPYHTIIPGMLTWPDGSLYGPFGVMGGFMQPQGHVQVLVAMLDDAQRPKPALDRPRFCLDPVDGAVVVNLEEGVPEATARELAARGHQLVTGVSGDKRALFGRGQIILRGPGGALDAGSDPRADGYARIAASG
jgi:gamma-glutamyltranspeptidase/glutathione hydrolase